MNIRKTLLDNAEAQDDSYLFNSTTCNPNYNFTIEDTSDGCYRDITSARMFHKHFS